MLADKSADVKEAISQLIPTFNAQNAKNGPQGLRHFNAIVSCTSFESTLLAP
jgi:hypothetical protein